MISIVVATGNKGKVKEIAAALAALPVEVLALDKFPAIPEAEENGDTFAANAVLKATHYALHTGMPCLADDSGLEVDALNGAPGVYSARYAGPGATDEACNAKLLAALADVPQNERTARFRCVLAYVDPDGALLTAEGTCEGTILREPRGTGGFGYDPLFLLPGAAKTMAEMTIEEKNAVSHRGQALRNMATTLARYIHENRRA
ncbi:XTP/dITP diphosphatase [Anaeroselena agilis]|uniref:dITP/XTP pyrophosphatase n=1 Tax=Anaeroselena agilis TaxID=3063788 RepID=A0ABU3NT07_9FIRM|nr:XTP/dITP diphosphatase [Selenomonadales bacterium 4137-cl]